MSWSGTLRADGPGYHAELFYTSIRVPQNGIW